MTTQNVTGVLNCSSGFKIPLNATITDGTEASLTTDTAYTVTAQNIGDFATCLLYTSPSPRDVEESRMPSSA